MPAPQKTSKFQLPLLRRRAEEATRSLPALLANAERAARTVGAGGHARRRAGPGEKFWQFRAYDPLTDRPQDIDWRQSAKGDHIYVRQKEFQTAQTVLCWCAYGPGMNYRSDNRLPAKREAALVLALGLALLLTRAEERVGLLEGGMIPGRSDNAIEALGRGLLEAKNNALPAAASIPKNADFIMAGDFLDPPDDIRRSFDALAARAGDALVIQTLDPAEMSLPFTGRAIFRDAGGLETHDIVNVESVRAAYQKRIAAQIEAVKNLCRAHGWHYLLHLTDEPASDTLAAAWEIMSPQRKGAA